MKTTEEILKTYVKICSESNDDCGNCPFKDTDSCDEFIIANTEEAVQMLDNYIEEHKEDTYLDIFKQRMPDNKSADNDIIFSICRKNVFEGALINIDSCPVGNCEECWKTKYGEDMQNIKE